MIDFTKKIHQSDKFRQPALTYIRTGQYCQYPKGTSEYMNYWSTEQDRCINGYTADDGDFISGYNYFYLNYCPILRIVNKEVNGKVKAVSEVTFPDFWDYDYYYFQTVEEAQLQGKHLCVLKSRRRGYSYKAASMMCRNYYLMPNTSSYVYASNKQYLTDDGVLTKAWNYMDFIDEHTAWGKKRTVNTQLRRRAGMWVKDEYGNQIEVGYKSEIIGVTLKDNPDVGHPYDQVVYTPEGKKKWEDITVGSKLFDSRGGVTTVTEVNELGKVPVYRLTLSDGRIVEATADHKWRIFRYRHKQHSWNGKNEKREIREIELTTEEIFGLTKNKSYKTNRCRIKTRFSVPFNNQEVPIDAYTMGFLLGDGSLTKTSNHKAYFVQSTEDYESIKHLFPYKVDRQYGITYAVNIPNAKQIIKGLNLLDKTSDNKFIPDCYKYNCEEIRIAVLNGLLDTDGSITKDYGVIEYVSKSYQLAQDVRWLLFSLGINNSLHVKYIKGTPYYRVYIYCSGEEHRLFCIPRKKERISIKKSTPFALSKVRYTYIDKVEKIEDKVSKCVTVDAEDHVYMIGDFIETKNCRGKRANLILFEEAGSFKELSAAWQIARPSVEIDGRAFATMIAYGTGGDEESNFFTLKDMFYHPEGYNCLALPNIWDENVSNTSCGFFVPQYTNMDLRDEQGKRLYMDKDGNTLTIPARQYILEERRKVIENSTNSVAVDRYVAERPITPAEACLEFNGNIFPKKELQEQLGKIRTNKSLSNHKQVGDLIWESDGSLKWLLKKNGDITHYPLNKNDDPTGSIVIWEHPVKDAPTGLYIMGCLTPGEKVLTDKGLVNVEDVDFSYRLINRYGEYDRIINLQRYNKINEPVFRIKPTGSYRTTQFTGEHPILLSNNTFVKAKDLKVGDELVIPNRYTVIKNDYLTIIEEELGVDPNNPKLWRFLGIWLGDGFNNINRNSYDIYVAFGKDQIEQANKYSELVLEVFNRKTIWCKSNGGQTRRFTNRKLVEFLNKYFGKYAESKRIPEWAMYLPEDLKRSFIIGYLDSDGSVFKDRAHYKVTFTSVNLSLLEQIQQLLYSIRICSSITLKQKAGNYTINNKTQHKLDAYCLKIASQDTLLLLDNSDKVEVGFKLGLLYNYDRTQLSKRPRYAKISEDGKSIYLKIQKIDQSLYTGIVYNFECESHTYMCHDIVSHNCDPYDHDQSGTNSLGSVFVYKRFQNFENYYDLIVAEYTGRPSTAEEFYENVRKLAIYYNARIMYENQNKGLFPYFVAKHCDYLLADQPDILNDIIGNSKVNRKKGCHMTKQIKQWGEGLIKDWLNEEKAPGHKNLHDILSEPLLEELISYNDIGNFDRVCSLIQVMIYREQLYNIVVKEKKKQNKSRLLFDGPIFNEDSWYDDIVNNVEEDVYTFN